MSPRVDIEALRAAADRKTQDPILGECELVPRRYLKSIELELRAGREAQAELARIRRLAA